MLASFNLLLPSGKATKIVTTYLAKGPQWIYVAALCDLTDIVQCLVGLKVSLDDQSDYVVGGVGNRGSRKNPHATHHGIQAHKVADFCFVRHERFAVQPRGVLDEYFVEVLATAFVLNYLLSARLCTLGQPRCSE